MGKEFESTLSTLTHGRNYCGMIPKFKLISTGILVPLLSGCAILHHAQVGQVDGRKEFAQIPFEIKVSEMGVSLNDAESISRSANTRAGDQLGDVAAIIGLFQTGPRTGAPVYDQRYAEKVIYQIHEKCPSGRVTGLMSIREMRKYPVISGEIVKITGYCLRNRAPASETTIEEDEIISALTQSPLTSE